MEINKNPFKLQLNIEDKTASIIKFLEESKNVFIPRYIQHEGQEFTIISIGKDAFADSDFESITFDAESEVEILETDSFYGCNIQKLEIPTNLKEIEDGNFFQTDITQFEISPGNKYFSYIDNKYLVCKSDKTLTKFDLLIYTKYDLPEAVIPSTIKVMREHSMSPYLGTLIFPDDTEIECIEYGSLNQYITKLRIPKTLKKIEQSCFQITSSLVDVEVSPENKNFLYVDDKFLLKKKKNSDIFNIIIFCRRDVVDVLIPSYVTKIAYNAFTKCKKMKSINFEPNSQLKKIDTDGFSWSLGPKNLVVPMSVKKVGSSAFVSMRNITFIEFLSEDIVLDHGIFHLCHNLKVISFPNAKKIRFRKSFEIGNVVLVNANAKFISNSY